MKKKFLTMVSFVSLSMVILNSCSNCDDEDPRARIINNGTKAVSVQIKTTDGNTENINNIATGQTSDYKSYAAGMVTFTISVEKVPYVKEVKMDKCFEYDIRIDANNTVTSTPRDRNE